MPLTDNGYEAAFIDTVRHFPKIAGLYHSKNPKYETFKQCYQVVYEWRNKENHKAVELPKELLPTALHAAIALYLYSTMVNAEELKEKL